MDITVSKESEVPLCEQVSAQVIFLIGTGRLKPGDALPSVRALARRLKIHHNTVSQAYQELVSRQPSPTPHLQEELAWVYQQSGDTDRAAESYRAALAAYRAQGVKGEDSEAALHGIRTCEAALAVLAAR